MTDFGRVVGDSRKRASKELPMSDSEPINIEALRAVVEAATKPTEWPYDIVKHHKATVEFSRSVDPVLVGRLLDRIEWLETDRGDCDEYTQRMAQTDRDILYAEVARLTGVVQGVAQGIKALSDKWIHMSLHEGKTLITTNTAHRGLAGLLTPEQWAAVLAGGTNTPKADQP